MKKCPLLEVGGPTSAPPTFLRIRVFLLHTEDFREVHYSTEHIQFFMKNMSLHRFRTRACLIRKI